MKNSRGSWSVTHGHARKGKVSTEYRIWYSMLNRCNKPKNQKYSCYGGRGIKVCERWNNSFENFFEDMGLRPSKEYTLDRINNEGNYTPENCRWATKLEQSRNRRDNVFLEYGGERMIVAEWARKCGLFKETITRRLNTGWSLHEALFTPPNGRLKS